MAKLRRRNRRKSGIVKEILIQTYTIVLPVLLGYIVWLLKNQKKDRDANSKGTMLLLRVQLIEYHAKYTAEIFAEDEAGNQSHLCRLMFIISGHELQAVVSEDGYQAEIDKGADNVECVLCSRGSV